MPAPGFKKIYDFDLLDNPYVNFTISYSQAYQNSDIEKEKLEFEHCDNRRKGASVIIRKKMEFADGICIKNKNKITIIGKRDMPGHQLVTIDVTKCNN
jgi:hypothetical protein